MTFKQIITVLVVIAGFGAVWAFPAWTYLNAVAMDEKQEVKIGQNTKGLQIVAVSACKSIEEPEVRAKCFRDLIMHPPGSEEGE